MHAGRPELFVADLHLSAQVPQIVARFARFLAGPARAAGRLTILGDLFDYWAGDDDLADPFNRRIVAALRAVVDSGVPVDCMVGNRDFLLGEDFAAAAGVGLLPDPCVREVTGVRTLLTHGDALCTGDRDYQQFRAQVRTPRWRSEFLAQPLPQRKAAIEALRARSEDEKRSKPMHLMDADPAAVAAALAAHQAAAMIHGHTHRQGCHDHAGRQRWVLGDWQPARGMALRCTVPGWQFVD